MDVQRLLDGFLGNGSGSTSKSGLGGMAGGLADKMPGGLMGGAAAGGLVAALLSSKKARKLGGKALTYGGLAVLGGLAYKAWSDHRANRPEAAATDAPPAAPADSGFDPARLRDSRGDDFRLTLVRAMVSASLADGHIDEREQAMIDQQIGATDLAEDERRFISDQLDRPADPIAIASLCADEPQATEVYLASLVVLDPGIPGDARYRQRLGDALRLPDDLRRRLEREVEVHLRSPEAV
ncbi:tellurite resistance TerB family protein [Thalassobaculum sp. OXR-137]|uniref:tellurite resistance TerB family protein n=1 Tax=Thalassobaculum sp. OXR-137 TaxID=3100173 RepID=UPI002AC8EC37|nr:tellurite resistance TerB family protein [Thalassobaculum sp. OXR-137]WPZ33505.1 tellurite resistance TerB family protein [Thalassobaculum sp. OXR-137]